MAAIERREAKRRRRRMRAKGCATLLRLAECLQLPGEAFVEAKLPPLSPICHGTRSKAGRKRKQVCLNPLPQPRRKATVSKRERDDAELAQCAKLGGAQNASQIDGSSWLPMVHARVQVRVL